MFTKSPRMDVGGSPRATKPATVPGSRKASTAVSSNPHCPVVAIGFSGDAFEGLQTFLTNLPLDTGMAFVVIPHSMTAPVTAASFINTDIKIPVCDVDATDAIRPDRIYIINPNAPARINAGTLRAAGGKSASRVTIDRFFSALAEEYGPSAVGVLLSRGSEGWRGLAAIHKAGGITFSHVEAPLTQRQYVDFVMPPQRIAQELQDLNGASDARFAQVMYTPPQTLRDDAPAGSTNQEDGGFFSDAEFFEALKTAIMGLLARSGRNRAANVWVADCDQGQTAYSVAIILHECLESNASGALKVFGTSADGDTVRKASIGAYKYSDLRGVSKERLDRFFVPTRSGYRVSAALRNMCVFSRNELGADPPLVELDLICCRNGFIGLNSSGREEVMSVFQYALKTGGVLALGKDQTFLSDNALFGAANQQHNIFFRNAKQNLLVEATKPRSSRGSGARTRTDALARATAKALQSDQEQLRAALKELKITKAELQATNERLSAVTEELNHAKIKLDTAGGDVTSILHSVNIPIVIVDLEGRVRRFTPSAKALFDLTPFEVGCSFKTVLAQLNVHDGETLISDVISTQDARNRDLKDLAGNWHSMQVHPYFNVHNQIDGAVISLFDVDHLARTVERALAAKELARAVIETVHEPLLVLDHELTVLRANAAFYETFGIERDAAQGVPLRTLGDYSWDIPELQQALLKILPSKTNLENFELDVVFPRIGRKTLLLYAREVPQKAPEPPSILLTIHDITERKAAEQQVREALATSESTVLAILRASAQAILAVNTDGRIALANHAAEAMFGFQAEQLCQFNIENLLTKRSKLGIYGLRSDGTEFPLEMNLAYLGTNTGLLAICLITDISERRSREETLRRTTTELRKSRRMLRALTGRLITAREEETQHLARELHDDFGQRVASIAMELSSVAEAVGPAQPHITERLAQIRSDVGTLADNLQSISRRLHPSIIDDLGLAAALRSECAKAAAQFKLSVQFSASGIPGNISRNVSLCMYRVTQEALRNIVKHASATEVTVDLSTGSDGLVLLIKDNGMGFNPSQLKGKGGLGLVSMEERARLVDASLSITSNPIDGTQVKVTVPLKRIQK